MEVQVTSLSGWHVRCVGSGMPLIQPPFPGPIPGEPSPDPAPSHLPSGPVPHDPVPTPEDPTEPTTASMTV